MKVIAIDTNEFVCQPTMGELLAAVARPHFDEAVTKDSIMGHGSNTWVVCYTVHKRSGPNEKRVGIVKWNNRRPDFLHVPVDVIA